VRDPRGVAYSWAKTGVARPHGGLGSTMATHAPVATAGRWAAFQSEIEVMARAFPRVPTLRYEDFVADPRAATHRAVCELQLGPVELPHVGPDEIVLPASHGVAGNPSRFKVGSVGVRADEAWRRDMIAGDRRAVTAITAPLLLRYGYPLSVSRTRP
jgi:hypothetical protein